MIKEFTSKVCFRIDSCRKRHCTVLQPPSDNSSNGLHSYHNYHHATDSHNTETSEPPYETEVTLYTEIERVTQFCHSFQ